MELLLNAGLHAKHGGNNEEKELVGVCAYESNQRIGDKRAREQRCVSCAEPGETKRGERCS